MESDWEEDDDLGIEDDLAELQAVLGTSYKSLQSGSAAAGQDPLSPSRSRQHAALAEEWENLDSLLQDDEARPDVAAEVLLREANDAAQPNSLPSDDPNAMINERQQRAIRQALEDNHALQKRLQAGLTSLERAAARVGTLRSAVEAMKQKYRGTRPGAVLAEASGVTRFWIAPGGATPEPNADTKRLLGAYEYLPHTFGTNSWTSAEDRALEQAVLTTVQEDLFDKRLTKLQGKQASDQQTVDDSAIAAVSTQLKQLQHDSPEVKEAAAGLSEEKWQKVALLTGKKRSISDCRNRWSSALVADKEPWTDAEDKKMLAIAKQHEFRNWPAIATELGNGRHPSACLARFQQHKAAVPATKWTAEEDERLKAAVARHGRNWQAIAAEVGGGRTAANALQRWSRRGLGVQLRKGRWGKEEDQALLKAVGLEGNKWSMVAKHVEGRSDVQCRERYVNVLDPDLNPGEWTAEEDELLRSLAAKHTNADGKISWVAVAAEMPGRTDNHVWRRWVVLTKGAQPANLKKGAKKKTPAKRKQAAR